MPESVSEGDDVVDGFSLADILNPDNVKAYINQETQRTQAVSQAPPIDVPIVEVPPPIILHGSIKIRAVFPYDSIVGQTYASIVQKVYDVIADPGGNNPWLPEVSVSDLKVWREVVSDRPATAAEHGGVPPVRDGLLPEDAVDPEPGVGHGSEAGGDAV